MLLCYEQCFIFVQILNLCLSGSPLPLTRPALALGISTKIATGVIRGRTNRKDEEYNGSPFMERGRLRAFLKDPLLKELGNCSG
jgi:hypothetical protein